MCALRHWLWLAIYSTTQLVYKAAKSALASVALLFFRHNLSVGVAEAQVYNTKYKRKKKDQRTQKLACWHTILTQRMDEFNYYYL